MARMILMLSLWHLLFLHPCVASPEQVEVPSHDENIRLKPLQDQRASSYQHQQTRPYPSCPPQKVALCSKSQRQLSSKNDTTHSFLGVHNSWFGKKVFFDYRTPAWWGAKTSLETKVFPTQSCSMGSGFQIGRETTLESSSYPTNMTKRLYPDPKAQGGLNHDFQQALQQKISPAEVREMLKKGF